MFVIDYFLEVLYLTLSSIALKLLIAVTAFLTRQLLPQL